MPILKKELITYIRAKTDQLLQVMGTVPLNTGELDDSTLLAVVLLRIPSNRYLSICRPPEMNYRRYLILPGSVSL